MTQPIWQDSAIRGDCGLEEFMAPAIIIILGCGLESRIGLNAPIDPSAFAPPPCGISSDPDSVLTGT